jgi:hypothetical protein
MKIVGSKEAGLLLGWDTRKVSTYNSRNRFPKPILTMASGPLWFKKQITVFYKHVIEKKNVYYSKGNSLYLCKYGHEPSPCSFNLNTFHLENNYFLFDSIEIDSLISSLQTTQSNALEIFPFIVELFVLRDFNLISEEVIHSYVRYLDSTESLALILKEY